MGRWVQKTEKTAHKEIARNVKGMAKRVLTKEKLINWDFYDLAVVYYTVTSGLKL